MAKKAAAKEAAAKKKAAAPKAAVPKYPRQPLEKVLRIPRAILDQNAGKECSDQDTAKFLSVKYNRGPYVSSNDGEIPFDLKHIRVIYYDGNDPYWGTSRRSSIRKRRFSRARATVCDQVPRKSMRNW